MNVRNITQCPTTLKVFLAHGKNLGCSVGNEYHCMMDEKKGHVELCISRSWIQPDHCPEYNTAANRIDVSSCDSSDGVCPPTIYWSNTSFQYSGCLRKQETVLTNDTEKASDNVLVPVVISVVIILLLAIICTVLLCLKKRKKRCDGNIKGASGLEGDALFPRMTLNPEQIEKGRRIIRDHRADVTYISTIAAREGKEILDEERILIIQGCTGSGKTKTALEIASKWMKDDESNRQCIYMNCFDESLIDTKDNTCIVLDECFNNWVLDSSSTFISEFCPQLFKQVKAQKTTFLIITIHSSIYIKHCNMLQKFFLFSNKYNIQLKYTNLEERKQILSSHIKNVQNSLIETQEAVSGDQQNLLERNVHNLVSGKCSDTVGFPSACWMYANIPECKEKGKKFFQSCEWIIQKVLDNIKNQRLICSLYYGLFRKTPGGIDLNDCDVCLNEITTECKCNAMTKKDLVCCMTEERGFFSIGEQDKKIVEENKENKEGNKKKMKENTQNVEDLGNVDDNKKNIKKHNENVKKDKTDVKKDKENVEVDKTNIKQVMENVKEDMGHVKEEKGDVEEGKGNVEVCKETIEEDKKNIEKVKGNVEEDGGNSERKEDKENVDIFSFSQTIIYEECFKTWLKPRREAILHLCSVEQVKENIRDASYHVRAGECVLKLQKKEFSLFIPRFVSLMNRHKELKYHPLLQNETFSRCVQEMKSQYESDKLEENEIVAEAQEISPKERVFTQKIPNYSFLSKNEEHREEDIELEDRPLLYNEGNYQKKADENRNETYKNLPV